MLTKSAFLAQFIPYPFALYQRENCIFEKDIHQPEVLHSFSTHLLKKTGNKTIDLLPFRGLLFATLGFSHQEVPYTLVIILKERITKEWQAEQWQEFQQRLSCVPAMLTTNDSYTFHHLPESNPFASSKKQVAPVVSPQNAPHKIDFTDNYQLETIFLHHLKQGNIAILTKLFQHLKRVNQTRLATNSLTQWKYRFVSLITIITRAAIQYGCSPNATYRLSDQMIQKLDALTADADFSAFSTYMLHEFSLLIQNTGKRYSSSLVNQAINFLQMNIYEKISTKELAEELNVNASYLSSLFHQHTGTTIKAYILSSKIEEAKYLIQSTDIPLQEIATLLHFSNQSHFCKQFKDLTTYTPKEYRILF